MRRFHRFAGMGDYGIDPATLTQLSQYSMGQIADAYAALYQTFQSESADYADMVQWANAGNVQQLSAADQQAYIAALQDQSTVVNNLQDWVSRAQPIIQSLGIQGAPGLSGLGTFPVAVAVVIVAVMAGIAVSVWSYNQRLSAQAHETTMQLRLKVQQSTVETANQLLNAGKINPAQYNQMLKTAQDTTQPPSSFMDQIPWTTLGLTAVGIIAIKAFLG